MIRRSGVNRLIWWIVDFGWDLFYRFVHCQTYWKWMIDGDRSVCIMVYCVQIGSGTCFHDLTAFIFSKNRVLQKVSMILTVVSLVHGIFLTK